MAKDRLLIRDARPRELGEAARVIRDAYLEYERFFPPEAWKSYLDDIMDVRRRRNVSELIIAEMGGKIAGAVTLYPDGFRSKHESWPRGWAGIRLLAIHPAFRGRGISRALMAECIRRCRERGIRTIGLHTAKIMAVAQGMYERIGFVRAPEYDFHPRPGTVVMAYRLEL
jgi:ribosomal protein S18 acetylase RimI-like enzyme